MKIIYMRTAVKEMRVYISYFFNCSAHTLFSYTYSHVFVTVIGN